MDSNVAELLSRAATQEPDKNVLSEAATGRTVTCSGLESWCSGWCRASPTPGWWPATG